MNVVTKTERDIPIADLARALYASDDDEFAEFWFTFSELIAKDTLKLSKFGKALSKELGSFRQSGLYNLCDFIKYWEIKNKEISND